MRRVGARRAVELADGDDRRGPGPLAPQPVHDDGDLLAHRRRGGWLAVGVREHRHRTRRVREVRERGDHRIQPRQPDVLDGLADRQRVGEVVDVLARAGEVDELGDAGEAEAGQALADEVLDGLDVVPGDGLELREAVDLLLAELGGEAAQLAPVLVRERLDPEHAAVGEQDEPLDLHAHAGAVEAGLGQVLAEGLDRRAVAAVEGADRLGGQAHTAPCRMPGLICRNRAVQACSIMVSTWSKWAASE